MTLPLVLLGLLERGPAHGYLLQQTYETRFGEQRPIRRAQVYSTLARLQRDGQVAVVRHDRDGGPDRSWYALTPNGVTTLEDWMGTPEPATAYLQSSVYQKLVLALLSGRDPHALLDDQRAAHLVLMRQMTAGKSADDLAGTLAADFTLFHLEADLRWLEHTAARLDRLAAQLRTDDTTTDDTDPGGTV